MLKKILAFLAMLYAAAAFAAVDINKATVAELDGVKGIGPALSKRILDERKKSKFKDWPDLIARVKGFGESSAAAFSREGLTVNGDAYVAAAAKKEDKKVKAKAEKKAGAKAEKKAEVKAEKKVAAAAKEEKEAKADKAVAAKAAASARK